MDQQERIEQIMKEPHPLEASDHEEKIRRNLLLASAVSFCFTYLKLMPAKDTSFMGLKFENLTPETIYVLLLAFVVYELIQYSWLVTNKFMYWRVRLTGINTQVIRGNKGAGLPAKMTHMTILASQKTQISILGCSKVKGKSFVEKTLLIVHGLTLRRMHLVLKN
ncbi:hypothetical protein O1B84_003340 [Vibrio cholerae]|nr:hypothetical protein [Vibrio cholerae]EKF9376877.1 hypothetical protein [Vibrio cholerae]